MQFDLDHHPYPSQRRVVIAREGMVATSQPLAAQAGLQILQQGGNAVDAAVAAAVCLTVTEPTSNGIGGDLFALVWSQGRLHGLNASGPAPRRLSRRALEKAGLKEIPKRGCAPVTVPGAPAGWAALSKRFGRLSLADVVAPAVRYAEKGFPVSPNVARLWDLQCRDFQNALTGEVFRPWFETFAPAGRAPRAGEIWRSEAHARTLQLIGETDAAAFYTGELAEAIDQYMNLHEGYLSLEDLAAYQPEWVTPISVSYRGFEIWEIPPNGHGLVALMALRILEGFDLPGRDSVETYHRSIEALKLAFADGRRYIADPRMAEVPVAELLSPEYAEQRRALIGEEAIIPEPGRPPRGGTVYLAAADGEGNMVSLIQSNYMGFGSGVVVPETGIALHNRGHNFTLDPDHPNALEPGKRPYHTIIPGFLTRGGRPIGPFGVMGGFMQPQGHVQVVMNTVDFALNPQAALDAPRWQWLEGRKVALEPGAPLHIAQGLARRGHEIALPVFPESFGHGQIIWRSEDGCLFGATEPRTDGHIAAW